MIRQPEPDTDAPTLALQALVWTLAEPDRAERLLAITGMDADDLRARVGDPAVLGATLQFLLANENDLLTCADALGVRPEAIARAGRELEA